MKVNFKQKNIGKRLFFVVGEVIAYNEELGKGEYWTQSLVYSTPHNSGYYGWTHPEPEDIEKVIGFETFSGKGRYIVVSDDEISFEGYRGSLTGGSQFFERGIFSLLDDEIFNYRGESSTPREPVIIEEIALFLDGKEHDSLWRGVESEVLTPLDLEASFWERKLGVS